jgi:CBS-domain-containing membrane protein
MNASDFCDTQFSALRDTDTVAVAVQQALAGSVRDLPVTDANGRFLGMFKIDDLLTSLLPQGALVGMGVPDLGFVHLTVDELRRKLRETEARPVRDFAVAPEDILRPDTSSLEAILLLHRGARSLPVVDHDGRLVGVVGPRDVLRTLHAGA